MSIARGQSLIVPPFPQDQTEVNTEIINKLDSLTQKFNEIEDQLKYQPLIDVYSDSTQYSEKNFLIDGKNTLTTEIIKVPFANTRINIQLDVVFSSAGTREKMNIVKLQVAQIGMNNWHTVCIVQDGGDKSDKHLIFDRHIMGSSVQFRFQINATSSSTTIKGICNYVLMRDGAAPDDGTFAVIWSPNAKLLTDTYTLPSKSGETPVSYWDVTAYGRFATKTGNKNNNDNSSDIMGEYKLANDPAWHVFSVSQTTSSLPKDNHYMQSAMIPSGAQIRFRYAYTPSTTPNQIKNENVFHIFAKPCIDITPQTITDQFDDSKSVKLTFQLPKYEKTNTITAKGRNAGNNVNAFGIRNYAVDNGQATYIKIEDEKFPQVKTIAKRNDEHPTDAFIFKISTPEYKLDDRNVTMTFSSNLTGFGIGGLFKSGTTQKPISCNMHLKYAKIGSSITQLSSYAFANCSDLLGTDKNYSSSTLLIPDTVQSVDLNCMFYNCKSLKKIEFQGTDYTITGSSISAMLSGCASLTSINIENLSGLTTLSGSTTFSGCSSLTYLDLRNIKHVESTAVMNSASLKNLSGVTLNYENLSGYQNNALCASSKNPVYYKYKFLQTFTGTLTSERHIDIINCGDATVEELQACWSTPKKGLSAAMGITTSKSSHHNITITCYRDSTKRAELTHFYGDLK